MGACGRLLQASTQRRCRGRQSDTAVEEGRIRGQGGGVHEARGSDRRSHNLGPGKPESTQDARSASSHVKHWLHGQSTAQRTSSARAGGTRWPAACHASSPAEPGTRGHTPSSPRPHGPCPCIGPFSACPRLPQTVSTPQNIITTVSCIAQRFLIDWLSAHLIQATSDSLCACSLPLWPTAVPITHSHYE